MEHVSECGTPFKNKSFASFVLRHGLNKYFKGTSEEEFKRLLGEKVSKSSARLPVKFPMANSALPDNFDSRRKWPQCRWMKFIRDQSNCGSCWAVASASVMSDRQCTFSGGSVQPYISDEHILACCTGVCGSGYICTCYPKTKLNKCVYSRCNGGDKAEAFAYWKKNGVPTGGPFGSTFGCQPYSIQCKGCPMAPTPKCTDQCIPQYRIPFEQSVFYESCLILDTMSLGAEIYHVPRSDVMIMHEMYNNGPVTASFIVYEDFTYYKKGVYKHMWGKYSGRHAVRVIGWGVENSNGTDLPYWLITNSWNTTWGMNGLVKFYRGVNECGIENNIVTGIPRIYV
ncbi:unnamed protein product [Soboliphyme baturini]|uniref:Pept_C1 domain-containing protein n=1 Tax=Soboliphyme baturini TaxID=241478 RepID=A0A183J6H7_9BILA|nr:unnamed protein product [Soboliphyme baturini]